jgi:hypothetical protein
VRRKWIASLAGLAAIAVAALAAAAGFGDNTETLPAYATVEVEMHGASATPAGAPLQRAKRPKQVKVLYFGGQGAVDVEATGPNVDVKLTAEPEDACPRVLDGGVRVANLDVFQQGSSVGPELGEYHVLIGFEEGATPVDFNFTSHLVCLKNAR